MHVCLCAFYLKQICLHLFFSGVVCIFCLRVCVCSKNSNIKGIMKINYFT